ncbi:uncharacterized protein [Physcomitrium patens]|uniref:uncharacterized protein isoform X2 n=1 Tax=Physcomitrium patens TaxID=3218 RepID=UPI003CCD9E01
MVCSHERCRRRKAIRDKCESSHAVSKHLYRVSFEMKMGRTRQVSQISATMIINQYCRTYCRNCSPNYDKVPLVIFSSVSIHITF